MAWGAPSGVACTGDRRAITGVWRVLELKIVADWPEIRDGRIPADRLQELFLRTVTAMANAYCPYSKFSVGALLLAENGDVFTGVNVENSSYGLTTCAERGAISSAVAAGARRFVLAAVATKAGKPVSPCGACRQVLAEFNPIMPVFLVNAVDGAIQRTTVDALLPLAFSEADLESARRKSGS